jgi:hypothetical protein
MPTDHIITILGCDTSNGKLIIDKPELEAFSTDTVKWEISPLSEVESIEEISEKIGPNNVWKNLPLKTNKWKGKIRRRVRRNYNYEYNIKWKKKNNPTIYTHDPKISINPSKKSKNLLITLITFLGLSSIIFFLNKKFRK